MPPELNKFTTPTGDKFQRSTPANADYYFGAVATAIWKKRHSIIQSVKTELLPYWGGNEFWHFNITFGYDIEGDRVRFADEYDPTPLFGEDYTRRKYPNGTPHGAHWIRTSTAWAAIAANKHAIVW